MWCKQTDNNLYMWGKQTDNNLYMGGKQTDHNLYMGGKQTDHNLYMWGKQTDHKLLTYMDEVWVFLFNFLQLLFSLDTYWCLRVRCHAYQIWHTLKVIIIRSHLYNRSTKTKMIKQLIFFGKLWT